MCSQMYDEYYFSEYTQYDDLRMHQILSRQYPCHYHYDRW